MAGVSKDGGPVVAVAAPKPAPPAPPVMTMRFTLPEGRLVISENGKKTPNDFKVAYGHEKTPTPINSGPYAQIKGPAHVASLMLRKDWVPSPQDIHKVKLPDGTELTKASPAQMEKAGFRRLPNGGYAQDSSPNSPTRPAVALLSGLKGNVAVHGSPHRHVFDGEGAALAASWGCIRIRDSIGAFAHLMPGDPKKNELFLKLATEYQGALGKDDAKWTFDRLDAKEIQFMIDRGYKFSNVKNGREYREVLNDPAYAQYFGKPLNNMKLDFKPTAVEVDYDLQNGRQPNVYGLKPAETRQAAARTARPAPTAVAR